MDKFKALDYIVKYCIKSIASLMVCDHSNVKFNGTCKGDRSYPIIIIKEFTRAVFNLCNKLPVVFFGLSPAMCVTRKGGRGRKELGEVGEKGMEEEMY